MSLASVAGATATIYGMAVDDFSVFFPLDFLHFTIESIEIVFFLLTTKKEI